MGRGRHPRVATTALARGLNDRSSHSVCSPAADTHRHKHSSLANKRRLSIHSCRRLPASIGFSFFFWLICSPCCALSLAAAMPGLSAAAPLVGNRRPALPSHASLQGPDGLSQTEQRERLAIESCHSLKGMRGGLADVPGAGVQEAGTREAHHTGTGQGRSHRASRSTGTLANSRTIIQIRFLTPIRVSTELDTQVHGFACRAARRRGAPSAIAVARAPLLCRRTLS